MSLLLFLSVLLHPVHETVSEVQWNKQSGRLEVAIRLDTLDEEWILRSVPAHPKHQPQNQSADPIPHQAITYLREHFRVADSNGFSESSSDTKVGGKKPEPFRYQWIGREKKGAHVWWYVEIIPVNPQPPSWLKVTLLFERNRNYSHRVLFVGGSDRQSLLPSQTIRYAQPQIRFPTAHTGTPPSTSAQP